MSSAADGSREAIEAAKEPSWLARFQARNRARREERGSLAVYAFCRLWLDSPSRAAQIAAIYRDDAAVAVLAALGILATGGFMLPIRIAVYAAAQVGRACIFLWYGE